MSTTFQDHCARIAGRNCGSSGMSRKAQSWEASPYMVWCRERFQKWWAPPGVSPKSMMAHDSPDGSCFSLSTDSTAPLRALGAGGVSRRA